MLRRLLIPKQNCQLISGKSGRNISKSPQLASKTQFAKDLQEELREIEKAGTFKNERIIAGPQGMEIRLKGKDQLLLNFCANNYLGLSNHPELVKAGKNALEKYGAGLSSVRFICGTQELHRKLEEAIAKFHGRDDAILYAGCFDANAGLFEVITGSDDAIISDEFNHASIIDGIRLSKAQRFRYKHLVLNSLEEQLILSKNCRRKIIATDGVFSMDGDLAPLGEIFQLADKYNALVFVDDCHATGFVGESGRGTEEFYGMLHRSDIINSTLGKAMGGAMGGYTTGSSELISLLRQRSRPYLFSNSLAPAVVGSALKVFELLSNGENEFANTLKANVRHFRTAMKSAGFSLLGNELHPICPVFLGDARLAQQFAEEMLTEGIYVIGFSYPVVPKGKARIRVQLSAAHTTEHIERCIEAFKRIGKKFGVI